MRKTFLDGNLHRITSQRPELAHRPTEHWFSHAVDWRAHRALLVFSAIVMALLLLSIACDRVFGSVDASVPEAKFGLKHLAGGSTEGGTSAQTPSAQPGPETKSILSGFLSDLERGNEPNSGWRDQIGTLAFRLMLAGVLGALVAFRPRSSSRRRIPCVVQSQILLAVVSCALMMIVGDSAARAFGIFAAASLIRFRTNIRDPKESTVLLINLGVGLASGVGRWEFAIVFTMFVLLILQILESYENHQVSHLMELSVRTHDVEATDEAVRELFRRSKLTVDIRELNKESERHPLGKVVYCVDVNSKLNTQQLAEEIYSADPVNIEKLEWHKKKVPSYA